MSQTWALIADSYRDLSARKLFWLTLVLSGFTPLVFLGLSITSDGISFFGAVWGGQGVMPPGYRLNTDTIQSSLFFKQLFLQFGVNFWLTFVAAILGLISTGGIFPDLLSSGSIDLYLSKPISRLRLFLTKYFTGLLFAALQVLAFCIASFVVLGIKGGVWSAAVFLAVPIVVLFFSYLFGVVALLGVWTRSSTAAILLGIVFMLTVGAAEHVEGQLLTAQMKNEIVRERLEKRARWFMATQQQIDSADKDRSWLDKWHGRLQSMLAPLPKTLETVDLMQRWLISAGELEARDANQRDPADDPVPIIASFSSDDVLAKARQQRALRQRPATWIIGSSLGFEAVVISLAAWIFCRRDY